MLTEKLIFHFNSRVSCNLVLHSLELGHRGQNGKVSYGEMRTSTVPKRNTRKGLFRARLHYSVFSKKRSMYSSDCFRAFAFLSSGSSPDISCGCCRNNTLSINFHNVYNLQNSQRCSYIGFQYQSRAVCQHWHEAPDRQDTT